MKKIVGIASVAVGIVVLLLSLLADVIGLGHAPGFGFWQISGSVSGVILVVEGIILFGSSEDDRQRKTFGIVMSFLGLIVISLSLSADLIGIGHAPGFGLWQISGSAAGAILVVGGLVLSRSKTEDSLLKTAGMALLIAGIVVLILSLTADVNGMGSGPGFGLWQTTGSIGGVIVAVLGFFLSRRK